MLLKIIKMKDNIKKLLINGPQSNKRTWEMAYLDNIVIMICTVVPKAGLYL